MEPQVRALLDDLAGRAGDDPAGRLALAETLHAHGLIDEAVAAYREVLGSVRPGDALAFQAAYLLAHAVRTRAPDEAAATLADALRDRPGYPAAQALLGEIREELGDPDGAEAAYREALGVEPGSALALFRLGSLALRRGRIADAVELLKSALDRAPQAGAVRAALAQALNASGDRERAREVLGTGMDARLPAVGDPIHFRMTERDVSSPRLLERGRAAREAGRLREAERWYRDLLGVRPRDPLVLAELGAVLHAGGQSEEAERLFRDAVALDPDQALARFGLGLVATAAGDLSGAEFHLRTALDARPDDPKALVALADVLLRQRRVGEGLEALDRALGHDSDDGSIHVRRAAALAELGRFDDAWEAVGAARAAGAEPPPAFLDALRARRPEPGA